MTEQMISFVAEKALGGAPSRCGNTVDLTPP